LATISGDIFSRAFVEGLTELDEAQVIVFSDRLLAATPLKTDPETLTSTLRDMPTGGGTAVNDQLYTALKLLEARQGRPVVVLLSDGEDVHSMLDMEQIREVARRSPAMVYWIRGRQTRARRGSSWRDDRELRRQLELLERTVQDSGGRTVSLEHVAEIEPAFREVLRELREQYALGFYPQPTKNDGSWRQLVIKVNRKGVKVRAKIGYVDF
jgi:Ca-activated chloride channel family protein